MPPADSNTTAGRPRDRGPHSGHLFEIPDELAYFNCASLTPQLKAARQWFTQVEQRRALPARLASVDAEGVALVPATSYGLAVAVANLSAEPGQRVLVLGGEYLSNYYT